MLQRINWRLVAVGYFLGFGLYLAASGHALIGAWSVLFGIGGLGIIYAEGHPHRRALIWTLFIGWAIVLGWITLRVVSQ